MKKLETELDALRQRLVSMGNLAEKMVCEVTDAIVGVGHTNAFDQIATQEAEMDELQLEIDKEVVRLLTVYSPVAGDLRLVMSIGRVNSELERIADHAVNLSESVRLLNSRGQVVLLPGVAKMATIVRQMVNDALNAFAQSNIEKARETIANDNIVDALNDQVMGELLRLDLVEDLLNGSHDIGELMAQLLIARSLERMADQATNVSEEVVYMVRGEDIRHQSAVAGRDG